jgi:hypothetical protein
MTALSMNILTLILSLLLLINIIHSYYIPSHIYKYKYKHVHRYNNDNDFIDAEIIDNKSSSSSSSSLSKDKPNKGIISSIFNFGKKLIGKDNDNSKLSVLEKKKREQKAQMNGMIDEMTKGTGLVGGIFGSVLKGVGGMITEQLAEASKDQTIIQDAIINKLSISLIASNKLGSNIVSGLPLQSSSSTINVNGNVQKSFSQVIQVQGSRGVGTVQAVGSVDSNGTIKFNQLLFQDSTSAITDLLGSDGGNSSGGRGTIIDTDAY